MRPKAEEVEARLAALGELFRLSESLRTSSGALLTWDQLLPRGLRLAALAGAGPLPLEPGDVAFEVAPSAATHHVGAVFTAGIERPGVVVAVRATLVAVFAGGRRLDALPARAAGVVVVRPLGEAGPLQAGLTLVDGRQLSLVAE